MHPVLDEIFDTLQTVCLGYDYYVTMECAQTICAPLLQNAQYATEVRSFYAHTRNRCVMKITKYPDVLALQYWPLFYTYFAIDFSERAIPANIVWLSLIWDTDWLNTVTWSTNISVCCPPQSCGGGTLIDTTHFFTQTNGKLSLRYYRFKHVCWPS